MEWKLFHRCLWKYLLDCDSTTRNSVHFKCPDTILFSSSVPSEWYHSSLQANGILRKYDDEITLGGIFRCLMGKADGPIIASMIWYDDSSRLGMNLRIRYLTEEELRKVLFTKEEYIPTEWILQAFLTPRISGRLCLTTSEKIGTNTFSVSSIINRHEFKNHRNLYEACVTVECVDPKHVNNKKCSIRQRDYVIDLSELIVQSLCSFIGNNYDPKELMTFYFNFDKHGCAYFLWGCLYCNDKKRLAESIMKNITFPRSISALATQDGTLPPNSNTVVQHDDSLWQAVVLKDDEHIDDDHEAHTTSSAGHSLASVPIPVPCPPSTQRASAAAPLRLGTFCRRSDNQGVGAIEGSSVSLSLASTQPKPVVQRDEPGLPGESSLYQSDGLGLDFGPSVRSVKNENQTWKDTELESFLRADPYFRPRPARPPSGRRRSISGRMAADNASAARSNTGLDSPSKQTLSSKKQLVSNGNLSERLEQLSRPKLNMCQTLELQKLRSRALTGKPGPSNPASRLQELEEVYLPKKNKSSSSKGINDEMMNGKVRSASPASGLEEDPREPDDSERERTRGRSTRRRKSASQKSKGKKDSVVGSFPLEWSKKFGEQGRRRLRWLTLCAMKPAESPAGSGEMLMDIVDVLVQGACKSLVALLLRASTMLEPIMTHAPESISVKVEPFHMRPRAGHSAAVDDCWLAFVVDKVIERRTLMSSVKGTLSNERLKGKKASQKVLSDEETAFLDLLTKLSFVPNTRSAEPLAISLLWIVCCVSEGTVQEVNTVTKAFSKCISTARRSLAYISTLQSQRSSKANDHNAEEQWKATEELREWLIPSDTSLLDDAMSGSRRDAMYQSKDTDYFDELRATGSPSQSVARKKRPMSADSSRWALRSSVTSRNGASSYLQHNRANDVVLLHGGMIIFLASLNWARGKPRNKPPFMVVDCCEDLWYYEPPLTIPHTHNNVSGMTKQLTNESSGVENTVHVGPHSAFRDPLSKHLSGRLPMGLTRKQLSMVLLALQADVARVVLVSVITYNMIHRLTLARRHLIFVRWMYMC